jgi:hypothetical protein
MEIIPSPAHWPANVPVTSVLHEGDRLVPGSRDQALGYPRDDPRNTPHTITAPEPLTSPVMQDRKVDWTTWWPWRGAYTRSHPELGREIPQRPWYCVSRHGRVGRRQVFQSTSQLSKLRPRPRKSRRLLRVGDPPRKSPCRYDGCRTVSSLFTPHTGKIHQPPALPPNW